MTNLSEESVRIHARNGDFPGARKFPRGLKNPRWIFKPRGVHQFLGTEEEVDS